MRGWGGCLDSYSPLNAGRSCNTRSLIELRMYVLRDRGGMLIRHAWLLSIAKQLEASFDMHV
jgi:hypothetical protein